MIINSLGFGAPDLYTQLVADDVGERGIVCVNISRYTTPSCCLLTGKGGGVVCVNINVPPRAVPVDGGGVGG